MNRKYKKRGGFIILMIALLIISCKKKESINIKKEDIENTIERALSWVYKNPAHFSESAFFEISEEIITFYILSRNSEDLSQRENYIREIKKRLKVIESKEDYKIHLSEYTIFPSTAFIVEKLGLETLYFRKIIEDQILSDPQLYSLQMAKNIWNTVYLERLGYNPPKTLKDLLPHSTLYKELHQQQLYQNVKTQFDTNYIEPVIVTIYNITHEIFALTDFGELPPPAVITDNQSFFSKLFDETIKWAITTKNIDVLAEIIMCAKFLDLKDIPSFKRGIAFIFAQQEEDGSFGIINLEKPNVYRRGVLVSIMALSMS